MAASQGSLDLDGLEAFVTAVERRSVAGTATALGTSRGRVRRLLARLDDELGVKLLERTRRGVEATPDGRAFLEPARRLLGEARVLRELALEARARPAGRMRVALQVGYPVSFAVLVSRTFREHFPDATTEFLVAERPADLLPDRADLALCLGEQQALTPCIELVIARTWQRLYATQSWLDARDAPVTTVQEAAAALHGAWRGPEDPSPRLHLIQGGSRPVSPPIISSDEGYLATLAADGAALVYLPLPPIAVGGREGLVPVLPELVGRELQGRLLVPERLSELPRVRHLLALLRALVGE